MIIDNVKKIFLNKNCYFNSTTLNSIDLYNVPFENNTMAGAFGSCTNLESVVNINENVTNMYYTFHNCYKLINAPVIPNSVTIMTGTFKDCIGLVDAPPISNSVTHMDSTFMGCHNLVNAPVIYDSVINMSNAFYACNHLVNVPTLSNSVINMADTFDDCFDLTTIPRIPDSVTNMYRTFFCAGNLTGDINIESENITSAVECFFGTSLTKNVYIPFQNNGVNTATYNAFITAGYKTDGSVNGVYLKDINGPSYATQIPMYKFTATGSGDLYFIGEYSTDAIHHTGLDTLPIETITGTLGQSGSTVNITYNGTTSTLPYVETKNLSNNVTLYVYGQDDSNLPAVKVCVIPESIVGDYVTFGLKWANASSMTSSSVYYLDRTYSKATYNKAFTKAGLVDI